MSRPVARREAPPVGRCERASEAMADIDAGELRGLERPSRTFGYVAGIREDRHRNRGAL